MNERKNCKNCNTQLIVRQTRGKKKDTKNYFYTAYYFCPNCRKLYHDDKFKVINKFQPNLWERSNKPIFKKEIIPNKENFTKIWTDGACVFNGRHNARAAWAFVSGEIAKEGLITGTKQTNNVAEATAILKALVWAVANNKNKIKIYTDSQISLYNLKKPARLIKINREIFQKIESVISDNNLDVCFEKVAGHSGDPNNTRADGLANNLAGKT